MTVTAATPPQDPVRRHLAADTNSQRRRRRPRGSGATRQPRRRELGRWARQGPETAVPRTTRARGTPGLATTSGAGRLAGCGDGAGHRAEDAECIVGQAHPGPGATRRRGSPLQEGFTHHIPRHGGSAQAREGPPAGVGATRAAGPDGCVGSTAARARARARVHVLGWVAERHGALGFDPVVGWGRRTRKRKVGIRVDWQGVPMERQDNGRPPAEAPLCRQTREPRDPRHGGPGSRGEQQRGEGYCIEAPGGIARSRSRVFVPARAAHPHNGDRSTDPPWAASAENQTTPALREAVGRERAVRCGIGWGRRAVKGSSRRPG